MGEESGAQNLKATAPSKIVLHLPVSQILKTSLEKKSRSKDNVNRASKLMCLIDWSSQIICGAKVTIASRDLPKFGVS